MSRADDRRKAQDAFDRELEKEANRRPNEPPRPVAAADRCYTGRAHDVSMKGSDGVFRCWYCVKTRAQIDAGK